MRKEEHPSLSLLTSPGPAAADLGIRPDAGQARVPGGGLDARYEQLRHAALHARASAFPLGLGVLTGKGVIAWRRVLARLASSSGARTPAAPLRPGERISQTSAPLPGPAATELIHALAGLAIALAGT